MTFMDNYSETQWIILLFYWVSGFDIIIDFLSFTFFYTISTTGLADGADCGYKILNFYYILVTISKFL